MEYILKIKNCLGLPKATKTEASNKPSSHAALIGIGIPTFSSPQPIQQIGFPFEQIQADESIAYLIYHDR
jgi:hypothetical protein